MRSRRFAMAVVLLGILGLAGCSGDGDATGGTFFGPERALGGGTARTYVVVGSDGDPIELGLRFTAAALDGLPDHDAYGDALAGRAPFPKAEVYELPSQARAAAYDHIAVDWLAHGHPPVGIFDEAHFDVRFYLREPAAVAAIDPADAEFATKAARFPAAEYLPRDYVPAGDPATETVPGAGLRWVDSATPFHPQTYEFTQAVLAGTWDGEYLFAEPMVTRDWLLTEPDFAAELKQPEAVRKSGHYATGYAVRYDAASREYSIVLTGLTERTAS
ncbi:MULTISPECIES: DUF5602 domain-containing protein [unclassified Nocardia]|uniref:DUF5602 domain-containing protein n=1 Tax=unclassified Nocardia TaxID=2637762 RepID=UPI00278BC3C7|nr:MULTISPECIES: DUF5602 domain-containing protein [unclassified Nocardia]